MQRVYTASTLSEARLVQQMLEAVGIHCHTFNEHAAGGLGELAATAVWPEVWIVREQQCALARSIIEEYEIAFGKRRLKKGRRLDNYWCFREGKEINFLMIS